ncbi:MAG: ATP-dependent zinc metalloprotease FtsH [Clostridiaceae bacterium]|nr:ATP-dependent zinc metalloprotease FtsH [Clostridiaceae bacterium]MDY5991003.1 ATP-dependent zinc metalloprotease FtsH [Oscillospiraceae bacterium]
MNTGNRKWGNLLYLLLPISMIIFIAFFLNSQNTTKMKYYEVVDLFNSHKVTEYSVNLSSGALTYKVAGDDTEKKYTLPSVELFVKDIHEGVMEYNAKNPDKAIKYDYKAGSNSSWWASMLPMLLTGVLLAGVMIYFYKKMGQTIVSENNRTLSFGKARVTLGKDAKVKTTFEDVAGADEEKEELSEIVEFLRNPARFNELGARIPKGVLLVGPPGTGKTLLARAVAGEAGVPFFSISGSDFVEMYVGVGASRVRDLFAQAKKNSPAILFIDEIDAVGRHRGAGMGGGHDEREQTLNQLLVEMDGFGANEGVIIIAATNRPDILDPALLRPGRFDRQITVGYPDVKGREAILKVHSRTKPLAPDVRLDVIAQSTVGFTGADLENLLNEAALLAARRKKKAITMAEIEEATIKVVVGTEKKSRKISEKEKRLTAYHESGHAIATYNLPNQDPVHQVSIIPRGMAGGFTMSLPKEERSYKARGDMLDDIVVLLGGRVAEALILGDISTGASNDIERATELARDMVTRYGMSDLVGPVSYSSGNHEIFLGRDYNNTRNYSETVASEIDSEINRIVKESYSRCEAILKAHTDKLHELAKYLMKHEKIDAEDFEKLMKGTLEEEGGAISEPALPQEPQQ